MAMPDSPPTAPDRLDRMSRGTRDGYWEWDVPAARAWHSARFCELLGYEAGELSDAAMAFLALAHTADRTRLFSWWRVCLGPRTPANLRVRLRAKSGRHRWFRVHVAGERDATGGLVRLAGSIEDVTEELRVRRKLIAARRQAESASSAKSGFLANVSHEIRTPMNGVIGMAALLLDTSLDRKQREYAQIIRSSAEALLTIINDVLDFSRIESGKLELRRVEIDPRALVEDVAASMAVHAAAKDLELVIEVPADFPARVIADPGRLRQVLTNLLSNAIKFTKRGEVHLRAQAQSATEASDVLLHFDIRDTGAGIDTAHFERLFRPFSQLDSVHAPEQAGTGLGLSIVKRLVTLMGGEVDVESVPGKGSTFSFSARVGKGVSERRATLVRPAEGRARILVVDDNDTNRRVLGEMLSASGYDIEPAPDASTALTALERAWRAGQRIPLVLADQRMPGLDGLQLGRRIRSDGRFSETRLVLLTSVDDGEPQRLVEIGFAGYLSKPVRRKELQVLVGRVLQDEAHMWTQGLRPLVTPSAIAEAPTRTGAVLVVDDDSTNRRVAQLFLERLGCSVTLAVDGREALDLCATREFDLVLMDLQMPVMDGMAATRELRARESGDTLSRAHAQGSAPVRRLPIVALTANARQQHLQECLIAGMDDFITKPIEPERLQALLEQYVVAGTRPSVAGAPRAEARSADVDVARLQELAAGDAALARGLIESFFESAERSLAGIRAATTADDAALLRRSAHTLKGSSANMGARLLQEACAALEEASAARPLAELSQMTETVDERFAAARAFFERELRTLEALR